MPPSLKEFDQHIKDQAKKRAALRGEGRSCPACFEGSPIPLGGEPTCWWECSCGNYSGMCRTWDEAFASEWVLVDPDLNARMYPPVGG